MAVAISVTPILIVAVYNGIVGWYPARDAAITVIRANDVLSSHPPLIGLPAFPSTETGHFYYLVGAPMMYLLALPVKVLGNSWGVLLTVGVVNTAWLVTALWLIRRRVGYVAGTLACVFTATLVWGIGGQALVDPTPVQAGIVASLTLMVAAWSVADGDPKAYIPFAAAANFTLLNHLQFMIVTPLVVATAVAIAIVRWRKRRAEQPAPGDAARRAYRRPLGGAAIVTILCWFPPIVDQLFFPSQNLSQLLRAAGTVTDHQGASPSVQRGIVDAIGVVSTPLVSWPLWLPDSLSNPNFWTYGPKLGFVTGLAGLLVVVGSSAFVMVTASCRGDHALVTGLVMTIVAWIGWILSGLSSATAKGWKAKYFVALWPLSAMLWFLIVLGVLRWARSNVAIGRFLGHPPVRSRGSIAAIATIIVVAILALPLSDRGPGTRPEDVPIARQFHRDVIARVDTDVPVIATSATVTRPYLPVVLLSLQEKGIDFRFRSSWDVRIYGSSRSYRPTHEPATSITLKTVPDFSGDSRLVSATGPNLSMSFDHYFELGKQLARWGESIGSPAIPESIDLAGDQRDALNREFATRLRQAREESRNPIMDAEFILFVLRLSDTGYFETIDVDGGFAEMIGRWFTDQLHVLRLANERHEFVFVTFRTEPSS